MFPENSSRNPQSHYKRLEFGIQVSLTKTEFSTWNPESTTWNPESKAFLDSFRASALRLTLKETALGNL